MKPTTNLRDQQFFSSTIQSKLDAITIDFQKHLCALLQQHNEDLIDLSKSMYKLRMDTINRLYKDPALTRRLSRHKRNPRLGDKRPLSEKKTYFEDPSTDIASFVTKKQHS